MSTRPRAIALVAVLLTAALVCCAGLDARGLWGDEALRLRCVNGAAFVTPEGGRQFGHLAGVLDSVRRLTNYQPGWYVAQHLVMSLAGETRPVVAQALNGLFFLGALLACAAWLGRRATTPALLTALCLLVGNQSALMHAAQIREYSLLLLCLLGLGLGIMALAERPRGAIAPRRLSGPLLGILLAMGLHVHLWCGLFALAFSLAALAARPRRDLALALGAAWIVGLLLFLPWMLGGAFLAGKVDIGVWDPRPSTLAGYLEGMAQGFGQLLAGDGRSAWRWLAWLAWGGAGIGAGVSVLARWRQGDAGGDARRVRVWLALSGLMAFGLFQTAYYFLREPLSLWPRYFICHLPWLALLAGLGVDALARRSRTGRLLAWTVAALALAAGIAQAGWHLANPFLDAGFDLRQAATRLERLRQPGEAVLAGHEITWLGLGVYWPGDAPLTLAADAGHDDPTPPRLILLRYSQGERPDAFQRLAARLAEQGYRSHGAAELGYGLEALRLVRDP